MKNSIKIILFLICFNGFAQNQNCACCTEDHKAFDFWIGSWEVTNPDGTAAGENSIERIQDGCVLRENWTSAVGKFSGTSMNFFNQGTKRWEQIWLDNSGSSLHLKGNKKGNQMILSSEEFTHTDGKQSVHRITWTAYENGTVRQLWEIIQDGEVASVSFNGLYKRIK